MVTSIARQSVIIKCNQKTSVLLGNYEFYYLAGLLKNLYGIPLDGSMQPQEMKDIITESKEKMQANSPQEEYMLHIVHNYLVLPDYDEQMKELFDWGASEKDMWKMTTSHTAYS